MSKTYTRGSISWTVLEERERPFSTTPPITVLLGQGNQVIAGAYMGIASTLLLDGTTYHLQLKIYPPITAGWSWGNMYYLVHNRGCNFPYGPSSRGALMDDLSNDENDMNEVEPERKTH
ncbi:hypothetical protein OUZ56_009642 [Daphnia magna]|uniref:Uncharacterized protein n=1 Tax=Daphnia magna TaxID=35525 RepID=A0ABR0AGK6_9CRUS|nr:hypothetical protein OUZ56_009642 [Daphnia magna]